MKFFGEISKSEAQDDGTIKVYGVASVGTADSTGETITAACLKAALPSYMKFGAVREMHQNLAAGTALSADVNDRGELEFAAHIVDPIAVAKVKAGVYKGFSVGGKCRGRDALNKTVITAMDLTEISLVDRPAHPEALINIWKADMSIETETTPIVVEVSTEAIASDIQKAGKKFSKGNKDKIAAAHAAVRQAAEHLAGLGYDDDGEDAPDGDEAVAEKAAAAEDIQKAFALEKDDLRKAFDIEKADAIEKALAPVAAELTIAKARVVELEAMPAPAKAVLTVVEKSLTSVVEVAPITKYDGTVDETATAIKKAFQSGGFRLA